MGRRLGRDFFDRDTLAVARELIGMRLVRVTERGVEARVITETEAYDGPDDLASHASKGKTPRSSVMFGEPGTIYVYLVYGMHHMLNIVTGESGYPAAVLIRGVEGVSGPGRIAKALGVTRDMNAKALGDEAGLWIESGGENVPDSEVMKTPRIGVAYAGEWAGKPYRFVRVRKRTG